MTRYILGLAAVAALLAGCGTDEHCSVFSCAGCCQDGVCLAGTANNQCGQAGQSCVSCSGATACTPTNAGGGVCSSTAK